MLQMFIIFLISTVIFVTAWIISRLSLHATCDMFQYEKFIFPNKYLKGSVLEIGSGRGANLDVLRHMQGINRLEAVDVIDKSTRIEKNLFYLMELTYLLNKENLTQV